MLGNVEADDELEARLKDLEQFSITIPMISQSSENIGVYRSMPAIAKDRDDGHIRMIKMGDRFYTTARERDRYLAWLLKRKAEKASKRREFLDAVVAKRSRAAPVAA